MIIVGIDDTDTIDSPGTNQLAKAIVQKVATEWRCVRIVRHQLLDDPRVHYTSQNGSASISFEPRNGASMESLLQTCRDVMLEWYVPGSDPGLCIVAAVPPAITDFGKRCKSQLVSRQDARDMAAQHGIHLEGLGGTEGGMIGALAAVGLAATVDDGRIVQLGEWPDDLSGWQSSEVIRARDIDVVEVDTERPIENVMVDVGKHLRPNLRKGRNVVFVRPSESDPAGNVYEAVRLK